MRRSICTTLLLLAGSRALLLAPQPLPRAESAAKAATAPMLRGSAGSSAGRGGLGAVKAVVPPFNPDPAAMPDLGSLTLLADDATRMTEEAVKAAEGTLGWWGSYIKLVEDGIFALHDTFSDANVPFPYGLSIFCFVLAVKLLTLPLNWKQLSSSSAMKAMKPQQDLVRTWYGDNKEMLNIQTGVLFEKFDVNPLAGCLPSLAQIPVFLGVYYSVTSIAKAKVFTEGFLWIPSLSGPIADRREGLSWLTENWVDGHPSLGWEATLAYLTIPAILVCTQTLSLYLLGSFEALEESNDSNTQTAGLALRVLPFMLGWFAMNAPAGLGLYWVFNNILTTAQTVTIKKLTEKAEINIDVSDTLAAIGPRRDPVAMPAAGGIAEWVPGSTAKEAARQEAEAAAAAEAEAPVDASETGVVEPAAAPSAAVSTPAGGD